MKGTEEMKEDSKQGKQPKETAKLAKLEVLDFLDFDCCESILLATQIQGRDLLSAERKATEDVDRVFDSLREKLETSRQRMKQKIQVFYEDEYRKVSEFVTSQILTSSSSASTSIPPFPPFLSKGEDAHGAEGQGEKQGKKVEEQKQEQEKRQVTAKCETLATVQVKIDPEHLSLIEGSYGAVVSIQTLPKEMGLKILEIREVGVTTESVFVITQQGELSQYSHQAIFQRCVREPRDARKAVALCTSPDHSRLYCIRRATPGDPGFRAAGVCVYDTKGRMLRKWEIKDEKPKKIAVNSSLVYVLSGSLSFPQILMRGDRISGETKVVNVEPMWWTDSCELELAASEEFVYLASSYRTLIYSWKGEFITSCFSTGCHLAVSPDFIAICNPVHARNSNDVHVRIMRAQGSKSSPYEHHPPEEDEVTRIRASAVVQVALYQRKLFLVSGKPPRLTVCAF